MKILDLYKNIKNQRFVEEVFDAETYKPVRPQLTIIDAGAYEGEFSFYCLPFAKTIYAFEPEKTPFNTMKGYVDTYGLQDTIKVFNKALAGSNGERYINNEGSGGTALLNSDYPVPEGSTPVESVTLASFIKEHDIKVVDILKVDMESAENEVFHSPDFMEVQDRIKMIIGEHLQGCDELFLSLEFKKSEHMENTVYTR